MRRHPKSRFHQLAVSTTLSLALLSLAGCVNKLKIGRVPDEAKRANRTADSFPAAEEDYFQDMDYGLTKNPQAVAAALDPYIPGITPEKAVDAVVKGRNNWIVWTGGNDRFWDHLSRESVGALDLLKTLSDHPDLPASRDNRWEYLGLVNEPCFEKASGPREDRFGLWLDVRSDDCSPDPFENEEKYPGVRIGARGKTVPVGSYYGYATGIVGLRLFPNPAFNKKARKKWDPERYYTDPSYFDRGDLVKPYRVGMSCGFCHVGPNPSRPPADPENPKWENLNSNPGAQYLWIDRIFVWRQDESNYILQMFHSSRFSPIGCWPPWRPHRALAPMNKDAQGRWREVIHQIENAGSDVPQRARSTRHSSPTTTSTIPER